MSAVIDKPRAKTVVKKAPPAPKREIDIGGALNCLQDLLDHAWKTDDPEQDSGDSNRLLSSARYIVGHLQDDHADESRLERGLYDIAAQVKAAMMVPGDTPSAERVALVGQIGVLLSDLLDDPLVLKTWEPPASVSSRIDLLNVIPLARGQVIQALTILEHAAEHHSDDAVYGLKHLADWLDRQYEESESDKTPWAGTQLADLIALTASAVAVLTDINERLDCQLLHACRTILAVAMESLDDADSAAVSLRKAAQEAKP